MAIINGQIGNANEVMNAFGSNFNDTAQNLFNADYLGFDSRLNSSGTPNLKNVFYSTFTSDDVDEVFLMDYDATNDLYKTTDLSAVTEFIIIEATSYNNSWVDGTNDTFVKKVSDGKWVIYCDTGTDNVKNAQIHKSLWKGTNGSDQLILDFTTVTSVKSTFSNDVGKQAYYVTISNAGQNGGLNFEGVPVNTSTNTISSWSDVQTNQSLAGPRFAEWHVPISTVLNASPASSSSNETGTDKTLDDKVNPANMKLTVDSASSNNSSGVAIVLSIGSITWTKTDGRLGIAGSTSEINFKTTHSIPDMTAAGTFSSEIGNDSTLIFKGTANETVTNATTAINSQIDATSSEQISVSANGSTFTNVNNNEIVRATPTGTALWRKIVITRTDLSKEDKVTEQAVKFNYY